MSSRICRSSGRDRQRAALLIGLVAVAAFGLGLGLKSLYHDWRIGREHQNLSSRDQETREAAVEFLNVIGEDVTEELIELLNHPDDAVRQFAVRELCHVRPFSDDVMASFIGVLKDSRSNQEDRYWVAHEFGNYAAHGQGPLSELDQTMVSALETVLADRRDFVHYNAVESVANFARRDASVADVLEKYVDDSDERFRLRVFRALYELDRRDERELCIALLEAVASPDDGARENALKFLLTLNMSDVDVAWLVDELKRTQEQLPAHAEEIGRVLLEIDPAGEFD